MKIIHVVVAGVIVALVACGGTQPGSDAAAASTPAKQGPHAHAVTKQFSIEGNKLVVAETTYVDGMAMRFKDGATVALTEAPISACAKLAVMANSRSEFETAALGAKPVLMLVRNEEYPQGAILLVEPGSTTTLEATFPALVTKGDALIASGDIGDAGWGSIDATKYGGEKSPHVRLDVNLPYSARSDAGAVAADASAEAKWLRELQAKAGNDTQAVVDASFLIDPEDYRSGMSSSRWFDVLANWSDFSVVSLATDKGCATMVLRAPGFSGGYREAVIQTQLIGDVRKVISAQTEDFDNIEGDYFVGRIEHPKLGAFPVIDARAFSQPGVGLVVYFSDKLIGDETFESLVTKQRMLRAVSSFQSGSQYSFSHYDFGGPGLPVEQLDAGNSTTNAFVDEKEIRGLIKIGEGAGPHIAVNFSLALKAVAQ
ncbi:MAG: hypothetical protein ABIR27_08690 [Dokdonella sp.]